MENKKGFITFGRAISLGALLLSICIFFFGDNIFMQITGRSLFSTRPEENTTDTTDGTVQVLTNQQLSITPSKSPASISIETESVEHSQITETPIPVLTLTQIPTSVPTDPLVSTLWHGEYYNNNSFTKPFILERDDEEELIFDWGNSNPAPGINLDNFSIRWEKCMDFEERYYTFSARADDWMEVYFDEQFVLKAIHPYPIEQEFFVQPGNHCLTVEYAEGTGNAMIFLEIEPSTMHSLPTSSNPWFGDYFNNTTFTDPVDYERYDDDLVFDWGNSNPAPGINLDNFSIRWEKCMDFEERYYTFSARADDWMEVYFDEQFVLKAIHPNPIEQEFFVQAGNHCLTVEYVEGRGNALIFLEIE